MRIRQIVLPVVRETVNGLRKFYADLGVDSPRSGSGLELTVGAGHIAFAATDEHAFHHFALHVPGDRFEAARAWLGERATLLSERGQCETTFVFQHIDAEAVYVLDPAGNIVELIAFHDLDRHGTVGPFDPREMLGIAEVGLVVRDRVSAASTLAAHGLHVWQGAQQPERLQFVGQRGHSLILAPPGRGWLPTGRPAEPWSASVEITVDETTQTVFLQDGDLNI